jgi:DNA-binding NarL/FixJ family response regulator
MHAERARELGIDAFLMKPLAMQEFAETIQQVMAARRLPSS